MFSLALTSRTSESWLLAAVLVFCFGYLVVVLRVQCFLPLAGFQSSVEPSADDSDRVCAETQVSGLNSPIFLAKEIMMFTQLLQKKEEEKKSLA